MLNRLLLTLLLAGSCALFTFAQAQNWQLGLRAGYGSFTTYDDFRTERIEIPAGTLDTEENVTEPMSGLSFGVQLGIDLSDRLSLLVTADYLQEEGLYGQDRRVVFSEGTAQETSFILSSDREIEVWSGGLSLGLDVLGEEIGTDWLIGAGLSAMQREHRYRTLLDIEVDPSETDPLYRNEVFETIEKQSLGALLFSQLSVPVSDHLRLGLHGQWNIFFNEDRQHMLQGVIAYRW